MEVRPKPNLFEEHHSHPRDHEFISYKHINHYYGPGNHCFGYRVRRIPSRALRMHYHNRIYYCYEGVYYSPFGSYYVVCRPPFETFLDYEIGRALNMYRCTFNYYYTRARVYDAVYQNNRYIDDQYETIARNNETIARQNELIAQQNVTLAKGNAAISAQNAQIAQGRLLASEAYDYAQGNGLVQSYANANAEYYYQDGVFYIIEDGKYKVIIPPAGALVEYIPEDYDAITLRDGTQGYKVDETVYKVTVKEGTAYFEVMGQMYQ